MYYYIFQKNRDLLEKYLNYWVLKNIDDIMKNKM